ncbi:MAG TPA: FCD domain-containing protein [Gaiellaceae bacterium]|nr:FCD domain-containing protein [Gaiellaceae bacterium]
MTPDRSPGPLLGPLQLRTTGEQIAERLVTAIALGEFVPGQRLPPERALATMLGVSRRSVREALHSLAGDGYVEIVRGRNGGAVVRASWLPRSAELVRRTLGENWAVFEWLFDLRQLIEPLIARTAARRRSAHDVEQIQNACARYRAAGDREASRAADAALHAAVADATGNPYLANLSRQIRAQVSLGFEAEPYSRSIRERAIVQHEELAAAIAARRPEQAAELARRHFMLTERALRALARRVEAES